MLFIIITAALAGVLSVESTQNTAINAINKLSSNLIPCEEGWYLFGEKCYKIFGIPEGETWTSAEASCVAHHGSLVAIQSQELKDFLTKVLLLNVPTDYTWIGFNDLQIESSFAWSDGSVVNYTNWKTGEPNNKNGIEHCVEFYYKKNAIGIWNDIRCNYLLPFICQTNKNEQSMNHDPRFCTGENDGAWKYQDSCYHTVSDEMSWDEAENYCQTVFDGHLLTILEDEALLFLNYVLSDFKTDFWIGIKFRDGARQKWSSNRIVDFIKRDPNHAYHAGTCAYMKEKRLWLSAPCSRKLPFVCEVEHVKLKQAPEGWSCPELSQDWIDLGGDTCYIFETKDRKTWHEADFACSKKGGRLAIISSVEEYDSIHRRLRGKGNKMHIGLHRSLSNDSVFEWLDGTVLDYRYWAMDQPDNVNERCGELLMDVMKWNDVRCDLKGEYMCSAKKAAINSIKNTSSNLIPCEEGWYIFGDKCYKVFGRSERVTWKRAELLCKVHYGDLATIQSKELQDFLMTFLLLGVPSNLWIGLNDLDVESSYAWSDGSIVNYTFWESGQPNNYRNQDCVEMEYARENDYWKIGVWNDNDCDYERSFMCQTKKSKKSMNPDPRFCTGENDGAWKYQNNCYHTVSEEMSWDDAEKYCQTVLNGHLLAILNYGEKLFINYVLADFKREFWIGLKLRDAAQQMWSSKWIVNFEKWDPNHKYEAGTCAYMTEERLWLSAPCSRKLPFVCEVKHDELKQAPEGWRCPELSEDWIDIGGDKCYIFETNEKKHWHEANFACMEKGGHLASFSSVGEKNAIHRHVTGRTNQMHIGLHRSLLDNSVFEWADGTVLDYQDWGYKEPTGEHEGCTLIKTETMDWHDITCDYERGYICSAKKVPPFVPENNESTLCAGAIGSVSNSSAAAKCSIQSLLMSLPKDVFPDLRNVAVEHVPEDTEISYHCGPNTFISGIPKIKCGPHGWEHGVVRCIQGCSLGEKTSQLLVEPSREFYFFGEQVTFSCPPGQELSSAVQRVMCLGEKWSNPIPECKEAVHQEK